MNVRCLKTYGCVTINGVGPNGKRSHNEMYFICEFEKIGVILTGINYIKDSSEDDEDLLWFREDIIRKRCQTLLAHYPDKWISFTDTEDSELKTKEQVYEFLSLLNLSFTVENQIKEK